MLCRHCHLKPGCRARGLCWCCYLLLDIRVRYGPVSKFGRRGLGLEAQAHPLPLFPTAAVPGSPEKIAVLSERARQGYELFHPGDARLDANVVLAGAG